MKRKAIIAVLMAALMALSTISVFALDYYVPEDATSVTARFFVLEQDEYGEEFVMVSEDGEYVIYITEDTLVYFEDYVPLSDECDGLTKLAREVLFDRTLAEVLEGRNLRVLFVEGDQIEPISVKILFEMFVALPEYIDLYDYENGYLDIVTLPGEIVYDEIYIDYLPIPNANLLEIPPLPLPELEGPGFDLELNGELVVNNEILEGALAPFVQEAGDGYIVMVPLRVVAEALGYDVSWNQYLQSVQLGVAVHLWIGGTEAHRGRMAPIELSTAPILVDSVTFVPLDFFRNVLGQTAYVFEGQVVIETYSDMM